MLANILIPANDYANMTYLMVKVFFKSSKNVVWCIQLLIIASTKKVKVIRSSTCQEKEAVITGDFH